MKIRRNSTNSQKVKTFSKSVTTSVYSDEFPHSIGIQTSGVVFNYIIVIPDLFYMDVMSGSYIRYKELKSEFNN